MSWQESSNWRQIGLTDGHPDESRKRRRFQDGIDVMIGTPLSTRPLTDIMPRIEFTSQLAQHVECPTMKEVEAGTLREAFEQMFQEHPRLREYVMDQQGVLRQHISVFVDGEMLQQRGALEIPLGDRSDVFVMQALSGG